MKIGVITYHRANNYGAALQAYALTKAISKLGHECELIDYCSAYLKKYYSPFPKSSGNIKQKIGILINAPIRIMRKNTFDMFRRKFLTQSIPYNRKRIKETNGKYDLFIFGSDQVWNRNLNGDDPVYFGDFVVDPGKLNSYAVSFGNLINESDYEDKFISLLERYHHVGIREQSGVDLYKSLTHKEAVQVVDPVFLLTNCDWESIMPKRQTSDHYILMYHLNGEKTKIDKFAQLLSAKTKLKIVDAQGWAKRYPPNVHPCYKLSPTEFLAYIANADYVVTDSFHCTALSVILEKNFWAVAEKNEVEETRVGNLLGNIGLLDRLIPSNIDAWEYTAEIAYTTVKERLNNYIMNSECSLKEMLQQ